MQYKNKIKKLKIIKNEILLLKTSEIEITIHMSYISFLIYHIIAKTYLIYRRYTLTTYNPPYNLY